MPDFGFENTAALTRIVCDPAILWTLTKNPN